MCILKKLLISMIILISLLITNSYADFKTGQQICVKDDDGLWYQAEIKDTSSDYLQVHFADTDNTSLRWVKKGSALPIHDYNINDTAWVYRQTGWLGDYFDEGKIINKGNQAYLIHFLFDDSVDDFDEWKKPCDLFAIPKPNDYIWVKTNHDTYAYGIVLEHEETDYWKVYYGGYSKEEIDAGTWHTYTDTFTSPDIAPASPDEQKDIKERFDDHKDLSLPDKTVWNYFRANEKPDIFLPDSLSNPAKIKTIGLGNIVTGGQYLNVSFDVPFFTEPVNIIFAITMQSHPENIFLYKSDGTWHNYKTDGIVFAVKNSQWINKTNVLNNIPAQYIPDDTYNFYVIACKGTDLKHAYIWTTSFSKKQKGYFTNQNNQCYSSDILSTITPLINQIETNETSKWYDKAKTFVSEYKDSDDKNNRQEALDLIALSAYGKNNVYPFCWAAMKKLEISPNDTSALNLTAICLFELNKNDIAGKILDCAYKFDPDNSITLHNGGVYLANKGEKVKALEAFKKAVDKESENDFIAWDAYNYAYDNNMQDYQNYFINKIPANFPVENKDKTTGKGAKKLIVCCNCNGGYYNNLNNCLEQCQVSLACFTHICSPRLDCCKGHGAFDFKGNVCYPPKGLQVCLQEDQTGTISLKFGISAGGSSNSQGSALKNLFQGAGTHIGISLNFKKNNYSLFISGHTVSASKHKLTILTTDPNKKNWSYSNTTSVKISSMNGISISASTQMSTLSRRVLCELYNKKKHDKDDIYKIYPDNF